MIKVVWRFSFPFFLWFRRKWSNAISQITSPRRSLIKASVQTRLREMDFNTKFSSNKADSRSSSLSGIMLWAGKLSSPLHMPKQSSATLTQHNRQIGLKTQVHSEEEERPPSSTHSPNIVHCYTLPRASKRPGPQSSPSLLSSSSTAFRSSVTDDVIGSESGDYMSSSLCSVEGLKKMPEKPEPRNNHSGSRYRNAMTKQYPPPLPLLAPTGDSPGRLPLVFKREATEDGRLIITADIVKRREYMVAERENGRLIMKLIPVNDDIYCEYCSEPQALEEVEDDDGVEVEEELASEGSEESGGDGRGDLECGEAGDSDPFWKVDAIGGANGQLGQPGSAHLRPMTPVM